MFKMYKKMVKPILTIKQKCWICPKCKDQCIERIIGKSKVYDCQTCKDQISSEAICTFEMYRKGECICGHLRRKDHITYFEGKIENNYNCKRCKCGKYQRGTGYKIPFKDYEIKSANELDILFRVELLNEEQLLMTKW